MQNRNLFRIPLGGGMTASQIVQASNYDYVNPYITDSNFPIEPNEVSEVTVELIKIHDCKDFDKILSDISASKEKLIRPTHECALKFGWKYPDEQRHRKNIVFLHTPFLCSDGGKGVIVLYGSPKNRSLGLDWFAFGSESNSCFGFIHNGP